MARTNAGATSRRRGKGAAAPAVSDTPTNAIENATENAVELETPMAEQEKTAGNGTEQAKDAKTGSVELAKKADNGKKETSESGLSVRAAGQSNRPVAAGAIQVAENFAVAGLRPIATSNLDIFATILNNRPILASHLKVVDYAIPGHRPIFASDIIVRDDLTLPGGRPIVASDPHLLEASLLPGGRPIASNEIDDPEALMGYID